ncbi:MAG: zinc-binding dehydrogenase [Sphingosinicella sp.]|nr:zinc-binding dehydrogenase [Sphingosinicella sp.]
MKQILQGLKNGRTELAEVPVPSVGARHVLIQTSRSLVSVGTERMLIDFGKAGWISKARQQPDKVRMVLEKVRTDGLLPTVEAVRNKLDQALPLGYCNVGHVVESGSAIHGFAPGERVVSNGAHAEYASVPINLTARIPDAVSDEHAAFTVLGAIGLQGIRLAEPTLGETVVVIGLGLIGLLGVQLLKANGCRVIGLDFDPDKLALARQFGAETIDLASGQDPVAGALSLTGQRGVDAVLICASTRSSDPVSQAARMCRKRGRIVLVGVTGLELSRAEFYEKELTFQVSCSYGPGRYDPAYEEGGRDYPLPFVRWTEQRNFEAVLGLMAEGRIAIEPLISHRFPIDSAIEAYDLIAQGRPALGVILTYPNKSPEHATRNVQTAQPVRQRVSAGASRPAVAFIGAGNYANAVLAPAFAEGGARLTSVASARGLTAFQIARKHGFAESTTDTESLFTNSEIDALVVSTRHDTHSELALRALRAGKHLFVEKPLCLTHDQLEAIREAYEEIGGGHPAPILTVGFNRRFAPHVKTVREALRAVNGPKAFTMTVNAGAIPAEHWTQDRTLGGGRIVGEACHFIDLLRDLADSKIEDARIAYLDDETRDTASITLGFADGSIGTIQYFANGSKTFPKERLEVFAAGGILQLDNFRKLRSFGWKNVRSHRLMRQDKGQKACAAAFVQAISEGGPPPIPMDQIFEVAAVSIALANQR